MGTNFPEGCNVRLINLVSNKTLNGAEGKVAGPINLEGRYPVHLTKPGPAVRAHPQGICVKPGNLQALMQYDASAPALDREENDQPTNPSRRRKEMAHLAVKGLTKALKDDVYPAENIESIFGIQMHPGPPATRSLSLECMPIGNLVYNCWAWLAKGHFQLKLVSILRNSNIQEDDPQFHSILLQVSQGFSEDLEAALLQGNLPSWFETQIRGLMAEDKLDMPQLGPCNNYFRELVRRGFHTIKWDHRLLAVFSGSA
mmetsp:Transcript_27591/g.60358  ORF Transcript_27591/g.60358 Transcript_27591/m.60358 type:complete len:257 (-) Transcript_27591:643-1413(-)